MCHLIYISVTIVHLHCLEHIHKVLWDADLLQHQQIPSNLEHTDKGTLNTQMKVWSPELIIVVVLSVIASLNRRLRIWYHLLQSLMGHTELVHLLLFLAAQAGESKLGVLMLLTPWIGDSATVLPCSTQAGYSQFAAFGFLSYLVGRQFGTVSIFLLSLSNEGSHSWTLLPHDTWHLFVSPPKVFYDNEFVLEMNGNYN